MNGISKRLKTQDHIYSISVYAVVKNISLMQLCYGGREQGNT